MDDLKIFRFNEISLPLDLDDIETLERYEAAFQKAVEASHEAEGGTAARMRAYCEGIRSLFDAIFGEGTAVRLTGEKLNAAACDAAYGAFLDFVSRQTAAAAERRAKTVMKYIPKKRTRGLGGNSPGQGGSDGTKLFNS